MARYTAAAFIGSLLLFLVQPMLGRTMLPMFGGSAAVWGVYDVIGTKNGNASLTLDFSTTQFFASPVIITW